MLVIKKHETYQTEGVNSPLFDRLIDLFPDDAMDALHAQFLDLESLKASIVQELELILNTRPSAKHTKHHPTTPPVYGYPTFFGLNDFTSLSLSQAADFLQLAQEIEQVIRHFEPRLLYPQVMIVPGASNSKNITLSISGQIAWAQASVPFYFPISLKVDGRSPHTRDF